MSVAAQDEQDWEHPLQVPFPVTEKPFRQEVQVVEEEQFMQLRLQSAQPVPLKNWPGIQFWQLVADPLQVMQVMSQV